MVGNLFKSIFMLKFYLVGLCLVVGTWDYTRQAKQADYQYSFAMYKLSLIDRYGTEAENGFALFDTVKEGALRSIAFVDETGLLAIVGISFPDRAIEPSDAISESIAPIHASVILATAKAGFAPETSLSPRARSLR